ncbi:MAG TPA: thermonuclease family protein [Solirubrobacteraceae bacterium]|nr:thermonuclease family protein [Solirubrobacteraceae bacterium]
MRRALAFLALAAAVVALVVARRDERDRGVAAGAAREGRVVRVVDGDTIHVRVDGRDERVRYIGIDTPEDVKPDTPVQCFARAAAAANGRLVGGREVRLVLDAEPRDRYGRLLAYVFRGDDGLFVNAELVRDGFARTLTIPPNVRYARRFAGLVTQARRAGRGLWRACPP